MSLYSGHTFRVSNTARAAQVTPLFAAAPVAKGGLGFTSSELSVPLAAGGAVLMVWAVTGCEI